MKITIDRKSFVETLSIGSQMAAKAKGLTELENCKMTIKDLTATISSYDSEVAITKRTSILCSDGDFVVCIEPKALLAILRSIKDNEVELCFNENICTIKHKRGSQTMPYFTDEDFPTPYIDQDNSTFVIESEVLFNWMKEARQFVSTNTLYPSLMGVYLYCGDNECGVAATNMEILYHSKQYSDVNQEEFGASVSIKAIDALLPMINNTDYVTVMIGSRNVMFKTEDAMLISARTEKPYPNFRRIIPQGNHIEVEIDKTELADATKRALLMANEATNLLKISINNTSLNITSEDLAGSKSSHEECLCSCNGGDINIGVKGTYISMLLNLIENNKVFFTMSAPNRPILLVDVLNKDKILLLMPCQIV